MIVEDLLGAFSLTFTVGARSREIDLDGTSVDFLSGEFESFLSSFGGLEFDVSETTGTTRVTVGNDTGRDDLSALGEFGLEPVIVDVPGKLSDENGGRFGSIVSVGVGDRSVGLGLLGGSSGFLSGTLLGLLSGSFLHLLVLVVGRVGRIRVGRVGGRVVLLGGSGSGSGGRLNNTRKKEKRTEKSVFFFRKINQNDEGSC